MNLISKIDNFLKILFDHKKVIVFCISILTLFFSIVIVSSAFPFTEGWYSIWGGNLKNIYQTGFPFPPVYVWIYKIITEIGKTIGLSEFITLRIWGVFIILGIEFIAYKINRLFKLSQIASIIGSTVTTVILMSMEAFIIYDYTPFLYLLLLVIIYTVCYLSENEKITYKAVAYVLLGACSSMLIIGTKQNYIVFSFIAFLVGFLFRSKLTRYLWMSLIALSVVASAYIVIANYGLPQLISIFTDASYKGGYGNILNRIFPSIIRSFSFHSVDLGFVMSRLGIVFFIVLITDFILFNYPVFKIRELKINERILKERKYIYVFLFFIVFGVILLSLLELSKLSKAYRESGALALILLLLIMYLRKKNTAGVIRKREIFISIFARNYSSLFVLGSSVIVLNSMSGGTGAMDSALLWGIVFAHSFTLLQDRYHANSSIVRSKPYSILMIWIRKRAMMFLMFVFFTIPMSIVYSILQNGYNWWSIHEKFDIQNYGSTLCGEYDGAPLNAGQMQYVDRLRSSLRKVGKNQFLAFPHIPVMYRFADTQPYANVPVGWIDVLGKKASLKLLHEYQVNPPEVISFVMLPIDVYTLQLASFSTYNVTQNAFFAISQDIIRNIISGEYIVKYSYTTDRHFYVLLLEKKNVDNAAEALSQSKYFENYFAFRANMLTRNLKVIGAKNNLNTFIIRSMSINSLQNTKNMMRIIRNNENIDSVYDVTNKLKPIADFIKNNYCYDQR